MALPTNDDFANCELSLEELETIAAGGLWSSLGHLADRVGSFLDRHILAIAWGFIGVIGGGSVVGDLLTRPKGVQQ